MTIRKHILTSFVLIIMISACGCSTIEKTTCLIGGWAEDELEDCMASINKLVSESLNLKGETVK